jgi:hypothetical protein
MRSREDIYRNLMSFTKWRNELQYLSLRSGKDEKIESILKETEKSLNIVKENIQQMELNPYFHNNWGKTDFPWSSEVDRVVK